jgi:hypothetical protein
VFVAIFIGLGLPLRVGAHRAVPGGRTAKIPSLFWVFAAFAVLYGFARR